MRLLSEEQAVEIHAVSEMARAMPIPVMVIGDDERITAMNAPAAKLFSEDIIGRHYITVLRQPIILDAIENVFRLSKPVRSSYRLTESARDILYEVAVAPIMLPSFKCVTVVFEDHTERHDAELMRRDFVANVSHELRTPLTALLGFIETLLGPAADDKEVRTRFLSIMDREAKRMNRIVGDLLSLSKVESNRRVRPTGQVDIVSILRSVVTGLEPLAKGQEVTVSLEGATDQHSVPGDRDQLTQVFTNLIENAIKYGGRGKMVHICITAHTVEPTMRGPAIRIDVADQGEGIADEHIPRLTERFYRVDSHRSREMGGTGLGLAIVKHIIARHRGRLRIESHRGQGSCFSVILPYE